MMRRIEQLLNRVTMYRLLVYGLSGLSAIGLIFSASGRLAFGPFAMLASVTILLAGSYFTDRVLSRIWGVTTNQESWLITGLILFLILEPTASFPEILILLLGAVIANASKFVLAWRGRHVFNPAALAAAVLSLTGLLPTSWWIGSAVLWPVSFLFGLLVLRKMRYVSLVGVFVVVAITVLALIFLGNGQPLVSGLWHAFVASPLIFLGSVMLTEPATMPSRRNQRLLFAGIVALLYVTALKFGPFYVFPEVALLLGNLYAFVVAPKQNVAMVLQETQQISERVYNFVFRPARPVRYLPGQYMEWTLPNVGFDGRGNRRSFTIASSPTEKVVHLGIKFYEPSSSFKSALKALQPGDRIYASRLAGDFIMPADITRKLAFISGGIGVTPFRSMLKYLEDNGEHRDIVLLYLVGDMSEVAYRDVLQKAEGQGAKVMVCSGDRVIVRDMMAELIPDYSERLFYVSGSQGLVDSYRDYLHKKGVTRKHIKTDHFYGY